MRKLVVLAALLCASIGAQAKSHLSRDEIKIMGASQVQVVYVDPAMALGPYLDSSHRAVGIGLPSMVVADAVNQHRLSAFTQRLEPYQPIIDKAAIVDADYKLTQDTLAQVAWLQKTPWKRAKPQPGETVFLKKQSQEAGVPVVIFIVPQLLMSSNIKQLLLVCSIDIETVNPAGSTNIAHYDSSEFTATLDIADSDLPPAGRPQGEDEDDEDYLLMRLFSDGGATFNGMVAKLTPQLQSQLNYYFTGVKPD